MENENRPEKVFLGKVKVVQTKYGELKKVSFGSRDLETLKEHSNEQGWSNWNLKESQNGGYYLELDTWSPKMQEVNKQFNENTKKDDLPF
jgi:hypothetical protein